MKKQDLNKKMKNIKDFKPTGIDGKEVVIADLSRLIGNAIFQSQIVNDISILSAAQKIYLNEDFEVTEALIESAKATNFIMPWLKLRLVEWLEE